MFVTLEGIEGSGKSTLLAGLAARLETMRYSVVTAREPGGTPAGDAVRAIFLQPDLHVPPLTEALLINASRAALVADVIRPALSRGAVVLCDRYTDSTLAYQGYGRGLDLAMLRTICDAASGGLVPSLTLLLDLSVELSRERAEARGAVDRMERQPRDFYERAREGYLALAQSEPRWRVLDAAKPAADLIEEAVQAFLDVVPA